MFNNEREIRHIDRRYRLRLGKGKFDAEQMQSTSYTDTGGRVDSNGTERERKSRSALVFQVDRAVLLHFYSAGPLD